jgi:NADPH2:quinone reductase
MNHSTMPQQATGVVVEQFGSWRQAKIGTLPLRALGEQEVLIGCEAAALNFQDLLMIEGKYQYKPNVPFIPGSDAAGRVIARGSGVTSLTIGQKVAALARSGAFADYVVAQADRTFPVPDHLDAAKAAASTSIFATVVVALTMRGQLKAGERVLVTGAAGGVGIASIQYARRDGAEVVALVSSEAKEKLARQAGAHHVLRLDRMADCKKEMRDALAGPGLDGVDVVIDMVSGDVFDGAIRCLRPGGRLVVVGFASGRIAEAKTNYLLLKGISVVGSALMMGLDQQGPLLMQHMDQVYRDVAAGKLDPFITGTFPVEQFHQAAAAIADRTAAGKIVLITRHAN